MKLNDHQTQELARLLKSLPGKEGTRTLGIHAEARETRLRLEFENWKGDRMGVQAALPHEAAHGYQDTEEAAGHLFIQLARACVLEAQAKTSKATLKQDEPGIWSVYVDGECVRKMRVPDPVQAELCARSYGFEVSWGV